MHYNPILSKRLQPGARAVARSEINHRVNRSRALIARNARYRCAAFALLQDHSASSEEQNAAIQTKKKKGKK